MWLVLLFKVKMLDFFINIVLTSTAMCFHEHFM